MLGALVIVFREVIEAGLIVGIVLASTRGVPGRSRWVAMGVGSGVLGAGLVAACAGAISGAFAGTGQELLNAAILATAVVMLMWHNAWMARHSRDLVVSMRQVGIAVVAGERPLWALAVVVGLAVLREGSEVVLFLYGVLAGGGSGGAVFAGGLLGVAAGVAFTLLAYGGLLAIPARHVFSVTSILITLLAAGLAAQAAQFLAAAGVIEALDAQVWDTSHVMAQSSLPGQLLHTLIGYNDQPSLLQVVTYVGVIVAMIVVMRLARAAEPGSRAATSARV